MGDEGIFASTAEVQRKVGANASATANEEAHINQFMAEAESLINNAVTYNFSDNYATLNDDTKEILKMGASSKAAIMVINYDPDAIGRSTATLRVNVLKDEYNMAIAELKNKNTQDFLINS